MYEDKTVEEVDISWHELNRQYGSTYPEGSIRLETSFAAGVTKGYSPYSIPDWRKKIRDHQNATTSLSVVSHRIASNVPFEFSYHIDYGPKFSAMNPFGYDPTDCAMSGSTIPFHSGIPDPKLSHAEVEGRAWMDFLSKLRSTRTSFEGGTFLGELKETIQLLTRPSKLLRNGLDGYVDHLKKRLSPLTSDSDTYRIRSRKRKFAIYRGSDYVWNSDYVVTRMPRSAHLPPNRRAAIAQVARDTWLEFVFGVKPLLSDIDNAARALGNLAYRPPCKMVTGKFKKAYRGDDVSKFIIGINDDDTGPLKISVRRSVE